MVTKLRGRRERLKAFYEKQSALLDSIEATLNEIAFEVKHIVAKVIVGVVEVKPIFKRFANYCKQYIKKPVSYIKRLLQRGVER